MIPKERLEKVGECMLEQKTIDIQRGSDLSDKI